MYLHLWWLSLCFHAGIVIGQMASSKYSRLATIYASVNVVRSVLPRLDGLRICMFDSLASTPLVGRSLATISEISFAMQVQDRTRIYGLVETIYIAQIACWLGCLTSNQMFHVVEESLWTLCAFRIFIKCMSRRRYVASAITFIYMGYMVGVDIPMYALRSYPSQSMSSGLRQMATCQVNYDWNLWRDDAVWMTGYFVGGTQISLFLG